MTKNPILNIISNGFISGSTFIVGLIFLRNNMLLEYSNFVYLGAIMLLVQGVSHSSVTTYYFTKINQSKLHLSLCNNILISIIVVTLLCWSYASQYLTTILAGLLLSFHDFNKNYYISNNCLKHVLIADIILSVSKIGFVSLYVWYFGASVISISLVLLLYSVWPFLYYFSLYLIKQRSSLQFDLIRIEKLFLSTKWSSGDNIIHTVSGNIHIFLINVFIGPQVLAIYSAINSVYSVFNLFFSGVSQYYLPKLRRLNANMDVNFLKQRKVLMVMMAVLCAFVVTSTLLFQELIFTGIYSLEVYDLANDYISIFALLFVARVFNMYQLVDLRSRNEYKRIFQVKFVIGVALCIVMPIFLAASPGISTVIWVQITGLIVTAVGLRGFR